MTDQPDLFGRPAPCTVQGSTPCPAETGMFCRCRESQEGHTSPHRCLDCGNEIRWSAPVRPPPIVRTSDREYAHEAAAVIAPKIGKIQQEVIEAYRVHGDMTSKDAEALPEFLHYGRSTVQKRISELFLVGILELVPDAPEATYQLIEERINDPLPDTAERCPTCGQMRRVLQQ